MNNHRYSWQSQPMLEGMAAGNLLLSSSILLSGSTFTKVASLADILNLKIFGENTFYNIQNKYLLLMRIHFIIFKTSTYYPSGSSAHNALKEVVFDKNQLKDIQQLTLCCHTGNLEVYHSLQTKYAPKRQHFSYSGMVARTQLAALDHNANTGRQQATVSREWVAKPVFEKTTNYHLKPMLNAIVERKCLKPQERSATVAAPHIPENIASKPRPPKADVVANHTSRFSNN
ncbi:hypothetical protein pdam_00021015, partial [Pocillopora damicornis]